MGPLANDHQKNSMAFLDDNSIVLEGASFRIGSWIFITDGSGGFESYPIDRNTPEVSEATKRCEFDDFVDQLEEIGSSDEIRIQPEFDVIKTKTITELEEDLERLLEDAKQETSIGGKTPLSNCFHSAEPRLRKKKSKTGFKKTTRKKKPLKDTFTNIDNIDEKIEHCLQLAEDTFNFNTSREEASNQWTLSSAELEQDQTFIKYLEELDDPISEDKLAEWSHDIDLFMEGLNNPDKLVALWEQSKVKKIWDSSQNKSPTQLDQYLSKSHPEEDSVSIEDYMNRWCNAVQTPNSPTPQEDHRTPRLFSPKERDNLEKYDKFINELSIRIEGGWFPANTLPYDEDLLRHTLGLSPDLDQVLKGNRLALQPDSDKRLNPTRSRLLQSLQKSNCSPQIRGRGSNS